MRRPTRRRSHECQDRLGGPAKSPTTQAAAAVRDPEQSDRLGHRILDAHRQERPGDRRRRGRPSQPRRPRAAHRTGTDHADIGGNSPRASLDTSINHPGCATPAAARQHAAHLTTSAVSPGSALLPATTTGRTAINNTPSISASGRVPSSNHHQPHHLDGRAGADLGRSEAVQIHAHAKPIMATFSRAHRRGF